MTTVVENKFKKVWSDFIVRDITAYETLIDIRALTASTKAENVALGFFSNYSGLDGTAYGEGEYTVGLTEQQAYDFWIELFNAQQSVAKKQIINSGITKLSQSVFDGLILLNWATGKTLSVIHDNTTYELVQSLKNSDYDTVADMIINSSNNRQLCVIIATILRLADYGKAKERSWYRSNGVFKMRDLNEKRILNTDQLKKARFAYFAETSKFLPYTPEGLQRQIVKEYNATLIKQSFTFSGTSTFTLNASPSMSPIEKISVHINDLVQQHLYDFTINGFTLTISKSMNTGDIIQTTIKI